MSTATGTSGTFGLSRISLHFLHFLNLLLSCSVPHSLHTQAGAFCSFPVPMANAAPLTFSAAWTALLSSVAVLS
eukprot:9916221-Karenia_brevis.AAC.1